MPNLPSSWIEHDDTVYPYIWSHRALNWSRKAVVLGLFLYTLFRGWFIVLDILTAVYSSFLMFWFFFGLLAVISGVISLPWSIGHEMIEKKWNLSKQTWGSWIWDQIKGALVGAVLGSLVLYLVYLSVEYGGEYWWVACAAMLVFFSVILAQLAPILLIPLFFKLSPMPESELKQRLFALCKRFGVEVKNIYHLGMGEKTEKGNAAFVGLGRTKRILIGDTLYQKFPPEEVEAVFAHELGHQVHNDLWKGLGISTIFLFVLFYACNEVCLRWVFPYFGTSMARPTGWLVFGFTFSLLQLAVGWLQALYSRHRETEADRFARELLGQGNALASALERLTIQNFGLFKPFSLIEFFTYSHPAPWRRITYLRS